MMKKILVLYDNWLQKTLASVEYLFVIDVHTGLGSTCQEILVHKGTATDSSLLSAELGRSLQQDFVRDQAEHVEFGGGHNRLYSHVLPQVQVDFLTQEFGTYPNIYVLQALRDENRYHHYGGAQVSHKYKHRLKMSFCPADKEWRTSVIENGVVLFNKVKDSLFRGGNV